MVLQSATKIVLVLMSLSLIALTWFGKVDQETFKTIAIMVFSFYFGQKINVDPKEEIEIRKSLQAMKK